MNETEYWLWLTMVFGVGSRRIWEAMCLYETAGEAYEELSSGMTLLRLNDTDREKVRNTDISRASKLIEECAGKGISVIGYGSGEYPPQLRHIANPPAVLYYKGDISCLRGTRTVTAVGTRNASEYGLRAASCICGELASNGIVIVSGFALGTDITAQLAGADIGRPTACVLGCGIDVDYPRGNIQYRDHIIASGGVFISEYPPGTPPHSQNFPARNRILAALGRAAVVFEASIRSGSLITANLAVDHGRELFCLPPADIMSDAYSGNCELLRNGARLLLGSRDILDCFRIGGNIDSEIKDEIHPTMRRFGFSYSEDERQKALMDMFENAGVKAGTAGLSTETKNNRHRDKLPEKQPAPARVIITDDMPELHKQIIGLLKDGPVHADVLAQKLEGGVQELMTALTELEIEGAVRSLPGKMYEIME